MADTPVGQAAVAAADAAANIAKGVQAKATGSAPQTAAGQEAVATAPVDTNAGKEKYVVDGKERFLSPDEAKAYVQKGISFEPKISQLGRLQQETAQFLDTLKNDPAKILYNESFGKPGEILKRVLNSTKVDEDVKEALGQWYYNNVVVKEKMSPQERELEEYKSKAQQFEAMQKQQEATRIQTENQQKVNVELAKIKAGISEAMTEAGVPMDSKIAPQLAQRVARIMQLGYQNGQTVTPKAAMAKVRQEMADYQKSYMDTLDEDKLVEQLGKENAEKVRKYYLKQVKQVEKDKAAPKTTAKRDERKTITPDNFHDYLQDLKRNSK